MAKAESGLRSRIKAALEADGWSVITQHGSAYSPNVLDLTIVLAAIEVKTETGTLTAGQRNTIQRLRSRGIPAGVVRSVAEARQGMDLVRQGRYQMSIDMSFLRNLGVDAEDVALPAQQEEQPSITELMGMQGTFEEVDVTPAPEPDTGPDMQLTQADPEPEPAPAAQELTQQQFEDISQHTRGLMNATQWAAPSVQSDFPSGVLEQILYRLNEAVDRLCSIDDVLGALLDGLTGGTGSPTNPPSSEAQPAKRRGRPKKIVEESVGSDA